MSWQKLKDNDNFVSQTEQGEDIPGWGNSLQKNRGEKEGGFSGEPLDGVTGVRGWGPDHRSPSRRLAKEFDFAWLPVETGDPLGGVKQWSDTIPSYLSVRLITLTSMCRMDRVRDGGKSLRNNPS